MTDADLDFYPFGPTDSCATAPAPAPCVKRGAVTHRCVPRVASVPHRPLGTLHTPWLDSRPDDAAIADKTNKRGW